jgi:hypothetical protein
MAPPPARSIPRASRSRTQNDTRKLRSQYTQIGTHALVVLDTQNAGSVRASSATSSVVMCVASGGRRSDRASEKDLGIPVDWRC